MYYLILSILGYIFVREYVEKISTYYVFIMDLVFLGMFLYAKLYFQMLGENKGYLFKKESKIPWFLMLSSLAFYVGGKALINLSSLRFENNLSLSHYLFLGEQIIVVFIIAFLYLWVLFRDVLDLRVIQHYSFNIEDENKKDTPLNKIVREKKKTLKDKDEEVEVIKEIEEEKETRRKIPVIVISSNYES